MLTGAGWDGRAPLVALAPGAVYGGAKRWPPASFGDLADALGADGVSCVLVGGAAHAAPGEEATAISGRRARNPMGHDPRRSRG